MAAIPEPLGLKPIFDAGVAIMGLLSGGLKEIAPPEVPKVWVILGTITASAAFFTAKLLFGLNGVPISREVWFGASMAFVWAAIGCGIVYILTRFARTITYEGATRLAGSDAEYLPDVASDPQNQGKTRDELLRDAAGAVGDVWTAQALTKSRRVLGIEYTLFIMLLSLGLYIGIEAYNAPKADPTFAEKVAKLRDVHFDRDQSELGADAADILKDNAEILKDAFRQFSNATVFLEGYCDDLGSDEYNFALGYRRAEAVRQALMGAGIAEAKLTVSSHGKKESDCKTEDEPCRQKNRRVHLTAIPN